ncbi:hypothetical protein Maqu_0989 [Marinobacter nauticus VT8]|uniref:Type II toxin-antitoxin system RelE/ParE family toxin n=1 Tax=Marinobacter nauticus (strain ATCC 700491 / DSM 11845 / VT8) TaxID=351348 RepID=A1TZB5_MARN8|nr:hypothetical protein Maqu_0989 [Marinobacter nauticus VT8]
MAALPWNQWQLSRGMGGRLRLESVATLVWNTHIEEFEALANLVGESPKAWQVELPPDIRRAPLHRFPLSIVYRERPDGFQVLAVAHDRRRPQYWLGRL